MAIKYFVLCIVVWFLGPLQDCVPACSGTCWCREHSGLPSAQQGAVLVADAVLSLNESAPSPELTCSERREERLSPRSHRMGTSSSVAWSRDGGPGNATVNGSRETCSDSGREQLLGQCTCCCKEDVENEVADIARPSGVKQASHTAATTSEPEVQNQECPEHSKLLHSVSPQQPDDLHVPPPMEVITQGVVLGSASSNEKQEKLESSQSTSDIVPALDDKLRETRQTLEDDQASVAVSANQAPDQTNDTEHVEAVTLESITEAERRTNEESVLPGTKHDQVPQGPDDSSMTKPLEGKEDSFILSSPAGDKVKTSEVPESALKKEGDEGTDHDRKESAEKMPTFVEWKQKMLAEHEKGGEQPPEVKSSLPKKKPTGSKSRRNYASYECGAKVLATNAEADGAGRVLNEQMDEYMLNPCKAKIWFVVELCEMIQVSQVDIANFELFSSMPKDFAVAMSDRYPTRDWTPLGTFTALDQKLVQSFELHSEAYGKYIKVELLSRYGSEHYCPLSLLRVYGTSMIDDYEQLVEKPQEPSAQDDDEEEDSTERSASKNVVDRAKDVVISLFKVLRRDQEGEGVDPMAGAPCSDLNANCSIVNMSQQAHNATSGRLGCQHNRSHHFFDSVFQSCSTCSSSHGQPSEMQTLSETLACRFLRTALSLENGCTIDEPDEAPELNGSIESSNSKFVTPDSSYELAAASSSVEVTVSLSTQVKTMPSASAVNATSEVEALKPLAMPSSETAQPESTKALSSPSGVTTVSSSETSVTVDLSHFDNETALENLDSASELAQRDNTVSHTSTDSMTLQSSSQVSDSTADSATATPVIVDVPTSVKTSPSSTSVAGMEVASPAVDSALPNSVTTVSGVPPTDMDSGVLIIGPEAEGGSVVATVPLPHPLDELVPDADLQLREGVMRAPPPEAGALALSNQRESVFMRINNRIKALELNMSLSGQYLEELSRRYRHQMDEMQRAFNRTVNALNKTAVKAAEKDLRQQETLVQLQQQLGNLTEVVNTLLAERQTLNKQVFENHVCLILIEAIILATVFSLCLRRANAPPTLLVQQESVPQPLTSGRLMLKRRTASVGHEERIEELSTVAEKKQKSSNEENSLVIVEPAMPIVVEAAPSPKEKTKKVNKQKKHKGPRRKTSLPCYPSSKADSGNRAKECRIPESNAGVLFSSRGAPRNTPPVPKAATVHTSVMATAVAVKGIGTSASKLPKGTESKSGQNGALKTTTLRPADCIRWGGQSCCDKDDHLGLIKFLRLPGKTPV